MKNRKIAKRKRGGRKTQKQEDKKRLADEQARKQEDEKRQADEQARKQQEEQNVRLVNKLVNNKKSKTPS